MDSPMTLATKNALNRSLAKEWHLSLRKIEKFQPTRARTPNAQTRQKTDSKSPKIDPAQTQADEVAD